MKRIALILILLFVFSFPVKADTTYDELYGQSGADSVKDSLDSDTKRFLDENGLDPSNPEWVGNLTPQGVFTHIKELLSGGLKDIIRKGAAVCAILMITAAFSSFGKENENFAPAVFASTLAVTVILAGSVWQTVSAATLAIKGSATFMLGFVPVFTALLVLSGGTVTAASSGALLLYAAEGVTAAASYGVLSLMGGYLAMSVCAGVSPLLNESGITQSVKKIAFWVLSLVTTVFLGVLGIQTAVNSAADSVALRTARFFIGTSVPIAGQALSEAVSAISSSIGLLRSSVGIYGVVAISVIMLPVVTELVLWRVMLTLCAFVSDLFSLSRISGLLRAVDTMLSVLLGIALFVGGMFIISLAVVVTAGRKL